MMTLPFTINLLGFSEQGREYDIYNTHVYDFVDKW